MDLHETYIRTADGDTYYPNSVREGIKDFLGENGYRISFNIEGVVITLRRDTNVDDDILKLDTELNADSVDCAVTIRGHKP